MNLEALLPIVIGLIPGVLIGYLFARLKSGSNREGAELEKQVLLLQSERAFLKENLTKAEEQARNVRQEAEERLEHERNKLERELEDIRQKYLDAANSLEKSRAFYQAQEQKIIEQKQEIIQLQKTLTTEFENIANKILEEKTQKFTDQNKVNLNQILDPLKDKIKTFEEKVDKHYTNENNEKISLREQLKHLTELNQTMSQETRNLTRALKGESKTQGNWGEFILESILEKSGLAKDREYRLQASYTTEDGRRLQPDVIITLPDNKNMVIDSKVSLVAYERFCSSETEEERLQYAREHLVSIKQHVKGLSDKNYQSIYGLESLDFVLLFVPIEPAFALGVQTDSLLFNDAFEKNIVLVSPSTLLATLRTVANIWRYDNQNKNALEIARLAGSLFDKLSGFAEDMNKIKDSIRKADEHYDEALKKLKDGRGNVLTTAGKIKSLGAKTSKSLPVNWDDTEHEEEEETE
jgi:DNA recombination protein RmuC